MRKKLVEAAGHVRRQTLQDVFEVRMRFVPVEPGRLKPGHHDSGTLTCQFAATE